MTSRGRVIGGSIAAAVMLVSAGVAIARSGRGGNEHRTTKTTPSTSTVPETSAPTTSPPATSTAPATTPTVAPPPPVTVPPPTTTVAPPATPIARPEDFTGSLGLQPALPVATSVVHVGDDLQIGLLVRNGSGHTFVIGDPTGARLRVTVSLVCSHLAGLANWSLGIVRGGTTWPSDDNTGITSHEIVRAGDVGNMTCRIAYVRGGTTPVFDPVSNGMISHDVTIVAPLPNIPAVHLTVLATTRVSGSDG